MILLFSIRKAALVFAALLILFSSSSDARELHTFHTSLTRMDYKEETKSVEVSIRLFSHDIAKILEKRSNKPINLNESDGVDELILAYLKEKFILKKSNGEIAKLVWVGKELTVDTLDVYFEIPLGEALEGRNLENTIFFEAFEEQTNIVVCRFDGKKADLLFKVGDRFKEIKERGYQKAQKPS